MVIVEATLLLNERGLQPMHVEIPPSCVQTISFADTEAPTLVCAPDTTFEWVADMDLSPANLGDASATDACDPNPTISYTDNRIDGNCEGNFVIERTWSRLG